MGTKHKIFYALHSNAVAGPSRFPVTYNWIKNLFAWRGMKSDINALVNNCSVCFEAKPYCAKLPWSSITLDNAYRIMVGDFHGLHRGSYLLRCGQLSPGHCGLFSKFAHYIPLLHAFTVHQVDQLFLDHIVYRLHGMLTHIVSDRDKIFTSTFWRELFRLAQTILFVSFAYRPLSKWP